jgi:hypothetical protein
MGKDRQSDLLAKIKRQTPEAPKEAAIVDVPIPAKNSRMGRGAQFWLHDEDRKLIRELYAWLANQGVRPNDSIVVRAALRMAKPGAALLEAYHEAVKLDGRRKSD